MIPGEFLVDAGQIELNAGRRTLTLAVANTGDRPVQIGSHYHFAETNTALAFDRIAARGFRLNIAAGTAVRFEPGQKRTVELVAYAGDRIVHGFLGEVNGPLERTGQSAKKSAAKSGASVGAGKNTKAVKKGASKKSTTKTPARGAKRSSRR